MADEALIRERLRLIFDEPGGDVRHAEEIYHEDAVLEFPQSGERYDGRATFTEWRSQYPAQVRFQMLRVTVRADLAVSEGMASYDGGTPVYGVGIHEFRGDKIARERIYVAEGWEAPAWREKWRSDQPVDNPGM
jgi:hypothetical protein